MVMSDGMGEMLRDDLRVHMVHLGLRELANLFRSGLSIGKLAVVTANPASNIPQYMNTFGSRVGSIIVKSFSTPRKVLANAARRIVAPSILMDPTKNARTT